MAKKPPIIVTKNIAATIAHHAAIERHSLPAPHQQRLLEHHMNALVAVHDLGDA